MAAQERNEDFELTKEDIDRFSDALKDKEFRKLFSEYCEEIQDPANRALYESEITELEKQRGVNVTFINPSPGYVIKTSVGGDKKAFINVCSNEHIEKPSYSIQENGGKRGINWKIPHTMAPPHDDLDKMKIRCVVYDVVFHPNTLRMAEKNAQFKKMLDDTACEAVESNHNVKLDLKNLKYPKLPYKGYAMASVIRKSDPNFTGESEPEDAELIDKLYPQRSFPTDSNVNVSATQKMMESLEIKRSEDGEYSVPKYTLKQQRDMDISEFTYEKDCKQNTALATALILEIKLPLLSSSAEAKLDVKDKQLSLISETPARYKLEVTLPYRVDDEAGSAKFDLSKRLLTITLPVLSGKMKLSWRSREDSGVDSDCNSPCASDEDNSNSLITEISEMQSSECFSESESYRTKVEVIKFLSSEHVYLAPPYTCHALDDTLAFTLHVKNVDPDSVVSELIPETNSIQMKFSSIGAGYFPIFHALYLKFPADNLCHKPTIETWDNNIIVQVEFIDSYLPSQYFIGLNSESLEKIELDVPVDSMIISTNELECVEKSIQPTVEVSARGNNEINISLTLDDAEEVEKKKQVKMIPIPKKVEDHYDSGIASSNGSSKGILKLKSRIGRSYSESSVDLMDYCGSPSFSIGSQDCIPEESSSLKKTVRFSNVIAKQTFRYYTLFLESR